MYGSPVFPRFGSPVRPPPLSCVVYDLRPPSCSTCSLLLPGGYPRVCDLCMYFDLEFFTHAILFGGQI